jgi:membrane-associated phospholipid phosphatase
MQVPWGLLALVAGTALAMVAITPVDFAWTVYLTEHRWNPAVSILRRTLFEGEAPGGSDVPIFAAFAVLYLYVRSSAPRARPELTRVRPWLGFVVVSVLAAGLGAVHTIKWVLGRARPYSVIAEEHLPFTPWYLPGPHFVTEGIYRGSFPSGHTAAAFLFIAVAYMLAGDPLLARRWRLTGWALGALTLLFTATMTVASAMARSHWLSDAIGVVGILWILVHCLYFWGLRVPEQRRYARAHGRPPPLPGRWELRLCLLGFPALLGLVGVGLGLRSLALQPKPYLAILAPAGIGLIALFAPRAWALLRRLHRALPRRDGWT